MSFDIGWQLEESCGKNAISFCHIEEIPGWATDGRVHKCILKYAYEIGSDNEISGFDFFVVQFGCWPCLPRTNTDTEEKI